jgi:hypothetical protein
VRPNSDNHRSCQGGRGCAANTTTTANTSNTPTTANTAAADRAASEAALRREIAQMEFLYDRKLAEQRELFQQLLQSIRAEAVLEGSRTTLLLAELNKERSSWTATIVPGHTNEIARSNIRRIDAEIELVNERRSRAAAHSADPFLGYTSRRREGDQSIAAYVALEAEIDVLRQNIDARLEQLGPTGLTGQHEKSVMLPVVSELAPSGPR